MRKNGSPEPRFETDDNYSYFITTLPVHPAFNSDDGLNDGLNDGVNDGVNELVEILLNISGLNATEIAGRMNKSVPTVERYLRLLRKKGIVEFVGAPKIAVITLLKRSITY
ncbi:MAG: hypothetical protein BGO34_04110 [Bacteroidia bacterium 44-10]|nr:MAG: hypothetical protein BGO34_04110 [Bacteroidia bacterium 44-10]